MDLPDFVLTVSKSAQYIADIPHKLPVASITPLSKSVSKLKSRQTKIFMIMVEIIDH